MNDHIKTKSAKGCRIQLAQIRYHNPTTPRGLARQIELAQFWYHNPSTLRGLRGRRADFAAALNDQLFAQEFDVNPDRPPTKSNRAPAPVR